MRLTSPASTRHMPTHYAGSAPATSPITSTSFEASLSDGSSRELIEEGSATPVTFATRHRFAELAIAARLHEGAVQCDAILGGLQAVVPSARLLRLMSGKDLQLLVCGEADVDLGTLHKHTKYGAGVAETQRHVKFFWDVLRSFTPEERRLFLTFVWGRNRLPLTDQDWGDTVMRVHELNTTNLRGTADQFFPVSH
eukprot:scaffold32561_cov63-Phaeocystis_antarctica.AAC.1